MSGYGDDEKISRLQSLHPFLTSSTDGSARTSARHRLQDDSPVQRPDRSVLPARPQDRQARRTLPRVLQGRTDLASDVEVVWTSSDPRCREIHVHASGNKIKAHAVIDQPSKLIGGSEHSTRSLALVRPGISPSQTTPPPPSFLTSTPTPAASWQSATSSGRS